MALSQTSFHIFTMCRWDGRLAIVVATDVAVYEPGSAAQATGVCVGSYLA